MQTSSRYNKHPLPVMKIGADHSVIYSNLAALPLINSLKQSNAHSLDKAAVNKLPGLMQSLRSNQPHDISLNFKDYTVHFTVVPFPEAGYIGFYGFQIDSVETIKQSVKIMQ